MGDFKRMKYLNIELSTLRSAEYVGSSPAERGTWLSVSAHCADQENGGRVVGGATWKDRQWQQACGVTMREVRAAHRLLAVSGEDIIVFAYPVEKEAQVRALREQSVNAARKRWGDASRHADGNAESMPEGIEKVMPSGNAELEGNRKGIGIEGNKTVGQNDRAAGAAPALSDEDWLKGLAENPAYSTLDVPQQHAKMCTWCSVNGKQPTRRRFVNWLNRCERPMRGTSGSAGQYSGTF